MGNVCVYQRCNFPECTNYFYYDGFPYRLDYPHGICCDDHQDIFSIRFFNNKCMCCGNDVPKESCFRNFCGDPSCKIILRKGNYHFFAPKEKKFRYYLDDECRAKEFSNFKP